MSESMQGLKRTHRCTELSAANVGEEVVVMGWVQRRRNLGQILFITLRDRTGLLQLSFGEHTDKAVFEKAETLRSEYVVAARGTVVSRGTDSNKSMKTGDIEIAIFFTLLFANKLRQVRHLLPVEIPLKGSRPKIRTEHLVIEIPYFDG